MTFTAQHFFFRFNFVHTRNKGYVMCRQRHEEAARYCSQQREAAAQQLDLQPSAEKAAAAAPVQDGGTKGPLLSKASPDAIRHAVEEKVSKPGPGAAGSSRDHNMLDVAAGNDSGRQTEAGCAAAPSTGALWFLFD